MVGIGLLVVAASACSKNSSSRPDGGNESVTVTVGEEGGEIAGPAGVNISIPPGALGEDVDITISVTSTGFETLPAVSDGAVFSFEPHGLAFNVPVTVRIPHAGVPDEIAMYTASVGEGWAKLEATKGTLDLEATVDHFSFFFNGREVCGLYRQECCTTSDGSDGSCAGDSLACVDNRCLECGFEGESCCGNSCLDLMQNGLTLTCTGQGYCQYPYPDAGLPDAAMAIPDDASPPDASPAPTPDASPAIPDVSPAIPDASPAADA